MGEQRNLTEENVDELKRKLGRMKEDNPDLEYRFFPQEDTADDRAFTDRELIQELIDKVEKLDRRLALIFDGHVLMNGQFVKYNPAAIGELKPKRG